MPSVAHRGTGQRGHLLDELGVEGRPPGQRGRVGGGGPGGQAGEALLVHQGGDAEPGAGDQPALPLPQPPGPLDRVDRAGAVGPGQVAQPVPAGLVEAGGLGELALQRGDRLAVTLVPVADELGELLLQRHPPEQADHPRCGVGAGRRVGTGRGGGLGRGHGPVLGGFDGRRWGGLVRAGAHPFTAPCRPLTIRRCIARKKTSAGIIARVVKANTPAVSEEYCEEKSATPRGSVFMSPCSRSRGNR